jgi:hypothetical protein
VFHAHAKYSIKANKAADKKAMNTKQPSVKSIKNAFLIVYFLQIYFVCG